ncbi:MAG: D-tyrosyl-tRNA(Tyr) deacylase [Candidatus Thermofonsia Clade 1 bacterium]|uniref:D-aminoacyl-tRNA deacylase n=1 Tax=Candidatus Thermofonsia Clade 1 bacterium TaxID=2364210 RepID=A0A2M8PAK2_9CHLR|nr:MAG: D-tyrosyl-tRNA(Tyr) deacylase [Candidatus Thermofonsia Clade 1 bacterium]RMF52651.1 MAG: D-tyrosyl-tRNA(Tyr) deacylase [Chloroflexota bacterium]
MRAVLQRVTRASVTVDNQVVGAIDQGFLILIGVRNGDTAAEAKWLAEKIAVLRVFADERDKFNRSLLDIGGGALVVSQFTLYGNVIGQRRPSFIEAAPPSVAAPLIEQFVSFLRQAGVQRVETGIFGAKMLVELTNDGPVTLILEREAPRNI